MLFAAALLALVLVTGALALTSRRLRRELAVLGATAGAVGALADAVTALRDEADRAGAARRASRASGPAPADR